MNWTPRTPICGDMIRVKSGSIHHYGVYVSDQEVIQFGLAPIARPTVKDCDVAVCASTLEQFLCGNSLEIGEPEDKDLPLLRSPEQIIQLARSRMGEKNYNILYNNCEHFAYECVLGIKYSSQTESVRALFRSFPVLDVYVAKLPDEDCFSPVYPPEREQEIQNCKNHQVKREKYYVWKLLEYALFRSFGCKIQSASFRKTEAGRWCCNVCEFSLSHSHRAVAVAISRKPVGIDIQLVKPLCGASGIAKRILNEEEYEDFLQAPVDSQNDFLVDKWTQKESIFKTLDHPSFFVADPKSFSQETLTRSLTVDEERYSLSIASENLERLRFYDSIDLTNV